MVNRRPNTTCDLCGTAIYRRPSTLRINAGKYCSRACRNKAHPLPDGSNFPILRGADNPSWKGGVTYFRKHGNYKPIKYVRCPEAYLPMARTDGYVMEHRLFMAQMAGYCLTRSEVVHHIDHDPQNNSLDNLELWPTNSSHKLAEHGRLAVGAACRWFPRD